MTIRRSLSLAGALALALILPAAVSAAPTAVDVRIEGKTSTIFFGPVTTDGKTVTTASGGTHICDGTNNGVSPVPVATATSALDDAAIKGGFTWDGPWSGPAVPDYFVTRVADEPDNATQRGSGRRRWRQSLPTTGRERDRVARRAGRAARQADRRRRA